MLAQIQTHRQQMSIIPQQIRLLNLFFLNSMELQQRINNELEENPFLEAQEEKGEEECISKLSKDSIQDFESSEENMYDDRPDYKSEYQNYFDTETGINSPIVAIPDFKEEAKQQLNLLELSDGDRETAEFLIDQLTPQLI